MFNNNDELIALKKLTPYRFFKILNPIKKKGEKVIRKLYFRKKSKYFIDSLTILGKKYRNVR